jgi:hypothetical protein
VSETLDELFPDHPIVTLDSDRELRLRLTGYRHLERTFGSAEATIGTLVDLENGIGAPFEVLPHFIYACLMDGDKRSPLTVPEIEHAIETNPNYSHWLTAVNTAVTNFFPPAEKINRKSGRAWSWEWSYWLVVGLCGKSDAEFLDMNFRRIVALAKGREIDMGIDEDADSSSSFDSKSKGRPISPTDFAQDGTFAPREE